MKKFEIHQYFGFTLVEMTLVVGIIGVLSAIALPNLLRNRMSANEAMAQATLKTIASALENYYAVNTRYPADTNTLLTSAPPYLNKDYFSGTHGGFQFTAVLTDFSYSVNAAPINANQGTKSYTITTGAVLSSP